MREHLKRLFGAEPGGISAFGAALFALALAGFALVTANPPSFDLKYSLYLDTASFYWVRALWDRELFGADPLAAFYYSNMFRVCPESFWVWPTAVLVKLAGYAPGLKLLAAGACAAAALMVRRLALVSPARPAAGAAVLLFAALFLSMDSFFGVPRVYGVLAFIAYAWAAEERRFELLAPLTALCFAVYPVVAAGLASATLLTPVFFREEFAAGGRWRRYLVSLAAGAALIMALAALSRVLFNAAPDAASIGAFESDKLYQMVPAALDPFNPADALANFVLNFNEHGALYVIFMALLAGVYGLGLLVEPRRPAMLPRSVRLLLAGGGAAFVLLYPLHPVTASRQLVFVLPLALVFLAAEGLSTIFSGRLKTAAAGAACAALFVSLHPFFNKTQSLRGYAGVYEFLAAQPRGSAVAGYPESDLVFTVPVFASQTAVLSAGTADQEVLFFRSPAEYSARRKTLLQALYCADPAAERRLAGYGASWLLLEKRYYSPGFLSGLKTSPRPADAAAAAVLAAGANPESCYARWAGRAVFSWQGEGGGIAVPLAASAGGAR
jgi:hypothetical protein